MTRFLRQKLVALVGLAAYLAGALVAPELHRRHHALHGADHVHTPDGTVYLAPSDGDDDEHADASHTHADFDALLAEIRLGHVAHAGITIVDCSLAAYTLATCEETHPHTFGDELFAQRHHRHAPQDPEHGRSALEHCGAVTLATLPFLLPPPSSPSWPLAVIALDDRVVSVARVAHLARGPPRSS